MDSDLTRRGFLAAGATAAAAVSGVAAPLAAQQAAQPALPLKPAAPQKKEPSVKPIVVSSWNGNHFKNGGPRTCVEEAFLKLTQGADPLDAMIAGVNIVELDPGDDSVGYGGLPNALGVVQLDASCMHGTKKRAGAVAALEGVRMPSLVAKAVLEYTDHHLIVGEGAQKLARQLGFKIEDDLNTDHSRKMWLEWKQQIDPEHFLDPDKREAAMDRARESMIAAGLVSRERVHGTIHCSGMSPKGEIAGCTTTSGLAFKIPGRVGDSPILGAGNYVDAEVGGAGSTGRGEANLYHCSSFLIVELMRQGKHPKDACAEALRRVVADTIEKRLLNAKGKPKFQVKFYAWDRQGRHAGVALYGGDDVKYAVCTENGAQSLPMEAFLPGTPEG